MAKIHYAGKHTYGGHGEQALYFFHCPGCKYSHGFHVPLWSWNGSIENATFTPSLLCNIDDLTRRCHSIVTDGKIQFLDDCWHELRGKTVEIPDWDGYK
jgi:Family of unknown function (DUF6527)